MHTLLRFLLNRLAFSLVALILVCSVANAQSQQKDSLVNALKMHTASDTARVGILFNLARVYHQAHSDSAVYFANEGYELADRIHFERGQVICLQQSANTLLSMGNYEKALLNYKKALSICEKSGKKPGESAALHGIGNVYYAQLKYGMSLDYYLRSLEICLQLKDNRNSGMEYISIGGVYRDMGNFPKAIQYYLDALKLLEREHYSNGISQCYTDLATVYATMQDYKKALDYINSSLRINEETGNREGMLFNVVNIGVINGEKKDYKAALVAFRNGLELAKTLNDPYWQVTCLTNMAEAYLYLEEYDTAFARYTAVLAEATKIQEIHAVASAQSGLGRIYIKRGNVQEGIKHLLIAFDITKQTNLTEPMGETAKELAAAYSLIKDDRHTLQYTNIYYNTKDSLFNEKNDKRIQQLQFDYELEKKETQITLLNKDKVIAKSRDEVQTIIIWASFSGLLLLIITSVVLYRSRQKEKLNKEEIVKQKEEIEQQAKRLESLNEFKDKTFSVLSHDLQGPIGAFTTTMNFLDQNYISTEEFLEMKPALKHQLNSLNTLLDSLLKWATGYMRGQMVAKPNVIDLFSITNQNVALLRDTAEKKQISLTNNIPVNTRAWCDPGQFDIVIRNLLNNALKFTGTGGTVTVSASAGGGTIQLKVTDSGIGMTDDQKSNLFGAASSNFTYGTDGERGLGFGLLLCHEFIKANNGTIDVSSAPGKGSTFTVTLPAHPGN